MTGNLPFWQATDSITAASASSSLNEVMQDLASSGRVFSINREMSPPSDEPPQENGQNDHERQPQDSER